MEIKNLVSQYDPENQFDVLVNTYKQIEFAWSNNFDVSIFKNKKFNSITVTGLGGSAISGDLMQNFLQNELDIPYFVNRNYSLPAYINSDSLLIASSYSGNTEETLEVLNQAIEKKCNIICVTTGGKMFEIAVKNNIPIVTMQKGFQPRYSLGLSFFSLLKILQEIGIIQDQTGTVHKITKLVKEMGSLYSNVENIAFTLAQRMIGFVPIIYSVNDVTNAIGNRFKCQLNENSKIHAFCNNYPELNHNEIVGWETVVNSNFNSIVLSIEDLSYHPQIKKRFSISNNLIKEKNVEIITLESKYETFKERVFDLIYLTDWISYYLAILRGKDPSEIDNIHLLKQKLVE
jgi:glucose/mannose-6-phosphate isomerase